MTQLIKGKQIQNQTVTISGSTGNVIVKDDFDMLGYQILLSNLPTLDTHASNKAYVDSVISGSTSNTTFIQENITPSNSGSTTNVVVTTSAFIYTGTTLLLDSVSIHLNGIQYEYGIGQGMSHVFYTLSTPTGTATTLYFDGVIADFDIETNDDVVIKYVTVG